MKATTYDLRPEGTVSDEAVQETIQKAAAFTNGTPAGTTLVLYRDEDGSARCFATFPCGESEARQHAATLGQAVSARPELVADGLSLDARALARLRVRSNREIGQSTLQGMSPSGVASTVVRQLDPGEWVGISIRRPTRAETRGNRELQHSRSNRQHQSLQKGQTVAAVFAGARTFGAAATNLRQAFTAMPGVDLDTRIITPLPKWAYALPAIIIGVLVGAVAMFQAQIGAAIATVAPRFPIEALAAFPAIGIPVAVALIAIGIMQAAGILWTPAKRRAKLRGMGLLPSSMRRWISKGVKSGTSTTTTDADGTVRKAPSKEGEYPLCRSGIMLHPLIALMIAVPHGDSAFGSSVASGSRLAPAGMRGPVGPVVGEDERSPVHTTVADAWGGTFVVGEPGSGKSYLLEAIWGWWSMIVDRRTGVRPAALDDGGDLVIDESEKPRRRQAPAVAAALQTQMETPAATSSGWGDGEGEGALISRQARSIVPGVPQQITQIGFDTKGDAAASRKWTEWSRKFGIDPLVIDIASSTQTFGIELFPTPREGGSRTPHRYAENVVDALRVGFGEDAIGPRSRPSLVAAFEAGALCTLRPSILPETLAHLRGTSAWRIASVLLGNEGDDVGMELASAILERGDRGDAWDQHAAASLLPIYGAGSTPSKRQGLFDAPRTKVLPMLVLETWWAREHQASWAEILDSGRPVILNFGKPDEGRGHERLSDQILEQMSAFVLYSLREAIVDHCSGWQDAGKSVVLFADEVKHLATEANTPVLAWFRSDGRSFGVVCYFATQFPEQLPDAARTTMLGYTTKIAFRQGDPTVREQVARAVSGGGAEWTGDQVESLRARTPIIKTTVGGESVVGFTAKVPAFGDMDAAEFARLQLGAAPAESDG